MSKSNSGHVESERKQSEVPLEASKGSDSPIVTSVRLCKDSTPKGESSGWHTDIVEENNTGDRSVGVPIEVYVLSR